MSVTDAMTRIAQIQVLLVPPPAVSATPPSTAPVALPAAGSSFASLLTGAQTPGATGVLGATATAVPSALPGATTGQRMVQIASAELGQVEQPPGSNDSARIAQYRSATAGSGVGPWCAYFTSWVAQQAGVPVGEAGQGFGAVASVAEWGQRTGRYFAAGSQAPQPGDLIVWGGRHIGLVESVGPDGSINTIEGNSSHAVSRRTYGADGTGATGFVRPG